jgi:hypothetical protein
MCFSYGATKHLPLGTHMFSIHAGFNMATSDFISLPSISGGARFRNLSIQWFLYWSLGWNSTRMYCHMTNPLLFALTHWNFTHTHEYNTATKGFFKQIYWNSRGFVSSWFILVIWFVPLVNFLSFLLHLILEGDKIIRTDRYL